MRATRYLIATSALIVSSAAANISLAEIPPCSLSCIVTGLASSGLGVDNLTLACANDTLQAFFSPCIQNSCNFTDQLKLAGVNRELCQGIPFKSRSWLIAIWGLVLGLLALLAIVLRCYSRLTITREWGYDDKIMVVVGVFLASLIALVVARKLTCLFLLRIVLTYTDAMHGVGRHYWDLDPRKVPFLLKVFWLSETFYVVVSTLIRASILIFFLRIFPGRRFKITSFLVLGLVIATGTAVTFTVLFQCSPVGGVWDRELNAKCVDLNSLAYAVAGVSILLDIIVLMLPIAELHRLKINSKKKIHLVIMFSLGSLACITSIVRLKFIVNFSNSVDQTWDNIIPAIWSLAEICVATICTCLPAIRILLAQWLPSIFDLTTVQHPHSRYKPKSDSKSAPVSQPPNSYRKIKVGPSYNKRIKRIPNEQSFSAPDVTKSDGQSTKRWITTPHFEDVESLIAIPTTTKSRDLSRQDSSNSQTSEVFALERLPVNNKSTRFDGETGIAPSTPTGWKGKGREIKVVHGTEITSMGAVLENELPPVPQRIISRFNQETDDFRKSSNT